MPDFLMIPVQIAVKPKRIGKEDSQNPELMEF
jgi:hypothetical protein